MIRKLRENLRGRLSLAEILTAMLLVVMLLTVLIPALYSILEVSRESAMEKADGQSIYEALMEAYDEAYQNSLAGLDGTSSVLEARIKQRHPAFEFINTSITLGGYEFSLKDPDARGVKLPTEAGIRNKTVYVQVSDMRVYEDGTEEFTCTVSEGLGEGGYEGFFYMGPDGAQIVEDGAEDAASPEGEA